MASLHGKRAKNFYAGPSTLPLPVLETLAETMVDFDGEGLSMIETSHRSAMYDRVHARATELVRSLLRVPETHKVLFLGGGATLQFAMVPLNLMRPDGACGIALSGAWAEKAMADAETVGKARLVFDGRESGYTTLPESLDLFDGADYVHITSNETINGVQWKRFPDSGGVPLVADMSSDIMSRPFDVGAFGLCYAGAQKNLGPAGVTLVVIRNDLVELKVRELPAYLSYATHAEKDSLYNTPPVFSIYALSLVLEWVEQNGGVEAMEEASTRKASLLYDAIDESDGFYTCRIDPAVRSSMNVVFRLPSEDLEKAFVKQVESEGMIGLKGHRSVGGCRASLYNALPLAWASALVDFMREFARKNG